MCVRHTVMICTGWSLYQYLLFESIFIQKFLSRKPSSIFSVNTSASLHHTWAWKWQISASNQKKYLFFYTLERSHAVKGYYQYQGFMGGVQLLQNLIHYGVGQIGDDWELHLPERTERHKKDQQLGRALRLMLHQLRLSLQGSVDILSRSLHQGAADGGARDRNLLGDGRQRRVESLGCWAGHGTELTAQRHHGVHHHLDTNRKCITTHNHRLPE